MPENTLVIKPSLRRTDLDSYDDIIENKEANGFSASLPRVSKLLYIIITDGETRAMLSDIVNVTRAEPSHENGRGRVNIEFTNVRKMENLFTDVHEMIRWNNRTNFRYIEFEP
jgi:hypothetical protein